MWKRSKRRYHRDSHAWPEVLKRVVSAGESVDSFCQRVGFCANSLRRWSSVLA